MFKQQQQKSINISKKRKESFLQLAVAVSVLCTNRFIGH